VFKKVLIMLFSSTVLAVSNPVKIMPLGDSITYENHFSDLSDPRPVGLRSAYRNYLWYKLRDVLYQADFVGSQTAGQDIEPPFDPQNEGHPSWTSYEIADEVYGWVKKYSPDIVLLHIGSNDWDTSVSGVETILARINLVSKEDNRDIKTIVALILDRASHEEWIVKFNNNLRSLVDKHKKNGENVSLVNMYSGAGIDYKRDMSDFTHPNDVGYEKMANVWFTAITGSPAPEKMYSQTPEEPEEEEIDPLYSFPTTLVDESFITSVDVNSSTRVVTFTSYIPDTGVVF
jgi:hypothetical protein